MSQEVHMPVTISILDKDYRIACEPAAQTGLLECARLLDERMREVRQNGKVIGADRIAVMAALNLLYDFKQTYESNQQDQERLAGIQNRVAAAVSPEMPLDVDPKSL